MKPVIRRITAADIPTLYAISRRVHRQAYTTLIPASHRHDFNAHYASSKQARERYIVKMRKNLLSNDWYGWAAEIDEKIVGYALEKREGEHLVVKKGMFVDMEYQKRGVGSALLRASLAAAKPGDVVRLSVIENNFVAKRLYERFGFKIVGDKKELFYGAKREVMECRAD